MSQKMHSNKSHQSKVTDVPLLIPLAGMVLVRTETGQLVMVPQQFLAQAQAKTQQGQAGVAQRPATPTAATTAIRVSTATTVRSVAR